LDDNQADTTTDSTGAAQVWGGNKCGCRICIRIFITEAFNSIMPARTALWPGKGDSVLTECSECSGRTFDETPPNAPSSAKHCRLLSSYLFNLERGPIAVREMIVGDIGRLRDLGARQLASDLSLVLNCFLADFPEARTTPGLCECSHAEAEL
jgi:hypothetical protein